MTELLRSLLNPATRESALQLALNAMLMAADENDAETALYITNQLADALKSSWQPRMHVRLRSVPLERAVG
jgi:glutathionylspermidine synthase